MLELDQNLTETARAARETAHRFATEVMRPAGEALDQLTPDEVIDTSSILWNVHKKYRELGLSMFDDQDADMPAIEKAQIRCVVGEEMGWGDSGLSISLGVSSFPALMAEMSGNASLIEQFTQERIGCWAITEPDHGTDMVDFGDTLRFQGDVNHKKPNCVARKEGNGFTISGQKAAWVSNGTIADSAALFCAVDMGNGHMGKGVFVVPLDGPEVTKGKPLNKIGQRALNQGEIFFDGLKVPAETWLCHRKPMGWRRTWCCVLPMAVWAPPLLALRRRLLMPRLSMPRNGFRAVWQLLNTNLSKRVFSRCSARWNARGRSIDGSLHSI